MGNFKREVKKAMNKLQVEYMSGNIDYPRVENSYIKPQNIFELVPHLPMRMTTAVFCPIKNKQLPLNKKTSLLFLSQKRLVNPSQAISYAEIIDEFFDEKLKFINNQKQEEFRQLYQIMQDFLSARLNLQNSTEIEETVKDKYAAIYNDPKKSSIGFYKIDTLFFSTIGNANGKKRRTPVEVANSYLYKKNKRTKDLINENFERKQYLEECFMDFMHKSDENKRQAFLNSQNINKTQNIAFDRLKQFEIK
ncbi:hypothetical protein [Campylobacter showae]|jgi:hypothetical protein|uniref:hypothetical protein n=1 Tax=Campylobacter showae TaxID=204 RepID=UPI000F0934B8|nr:hypothetical protein [Campylobacter showae]